MPGKISWPFLSVQIKVNLMSEEIEPKIQKRGRPFEKGHPYHPKSPEGTAKLIASRLGKPLPPEVIEKISASQRGRKLPPERIEQIRASLTGKKHSAETIERRRQARDGYRHSEETRRKMSATKLLRRKGPLKSSEHKTIRRSVEFLLWREEVYKRDNWTCQKCGVRGGKIHPHHIQNFADHPDLRFEVSNGITLCAKHHKEFHNRYGQRHNTRKQIEEYL